MALICGHDGKKCATCDATMETCAKCGAVDTTKRAVKRVAIVSTALAALRLRNAINESLPTCHMHVDVRETAAGVELGRVAPAPRRSTRPKPSPPPGRLRRVTRIPETSDADLERRRNKDCRHHHV